MTAKKQQELTYICSKDSKRKTRTECENCEDFLDCPYFGTDLFAEQQQKTMADAVAANPDIERQHAILELLGFVKSDEKDGIRYRKMVDGAKIARDFFSKNPGGRFWAKRGDEFLGDDDVKQLPIVAQFYELRDSGKPLPAAVLLGAAAGKSSSGKAVLVEIDDEHEPVKKIWFGLGAVKRNTPGSQGYDARIGEGERYVPVGFTRKTEKQDAKLAIPRPIVLADFDRAFKDAPVTQGGNGYHDREEGIEEEPPEKPKGESKTPKASTVAGMATEAVNELYRDCLAEGIACVNEILAPAYPQLTDAQKTDFALRIAQTLFIDVGKDRRTPR